MKIDVHAHYIPRDCFDMTDKEGHNHGPTLVKDTSGQESLEVEGMKLGPIVSQVCDPERRIQDMDDIGLDMQAISISPTSFFYFVDAESGLSFCQRHNNGIAQVVTAYPDRFTGMATVPMQDVAKAVTELERAVLQLGLKAVEINSNINGKNLDEPEFLPFFQKAHELDIPIFVHPHYVAGRERLQRYWLTNLIGNPLDTAIAIASIIFGGVLEKFPRLKFVLAHAGGVTPFIRGRWEHGYLVVPDSRTTPKLPSEYLKLVYFDTITHFPPALAYLVNSVGADRVVLGSDYPFAMGDLNPVATVRNLAGVSAEAIERVLESSSTALLKLAAG